MNVYQIQKAGWRICWIHNANEFFPDSFTVEHDGPHTILIGRPVDKKKAPRKAAVLKPKASAQNA